MAATSISSPPLASTFNSSPGKQVQYTFNSSVMVAAMVILFIVVLFVVSLHIYAKWFWRQGTAATMRWSATNALNASWQRRRRQLEVAVEDELRAANVCLGLDPSTVNLLPTFVYEGAMLEALPLLECAVCLSEFQVRDKGRILPGCKHTFHISCIDTWFHSHSTCPLCRTPIILPVSDAGNVSNNGPAVLEQNLEPTPHQAHADERNTPDSQSVNSQEPQPFLLNTQGLDFHPEEVGSVTNKAGHKAPVLDSLTPMTSVSHLRVPSYCEVFCKDDVAHANLPCMGATGSTSARAMPTETLRQHDRPVMPRSTSLSLSRVRSEDDEQVCLSQPQKSLSFRASLKRLVSRELSKGRSRVFPAGRGNGESEQSASTTHSPV